MDKLYIGDIPKEYHYARFNNNYIDFYNTQYLRGGQSYDLYRLYLYDNMFIYDHLSTTLPSMQNSTLANVNVTDNICYRRDFPSILTMTLIIAVFGIWLFNILSSAIRKGGGLGGLL